VKEHVPLIQLYSG